MRTDWQEEAGMNVLLINGSPHKDGCTYTALSEVAGQLGKNGIETNIFHIGTEPIRGCIACGKCASTGHCAFSDDPVNQVIDLTKSADGLVVGSPVYYASPNGSLRALLDRVFFRKSAAYAYKPAAAVVNCRRGGATTAFESLNRYFTISSMPIVSSQYWNETHGTTPDQVRQDLEGLQTMRTLGNNMAWLLKCIEYSKHTVPFPLKEAPVATNFIR
jgi:multimeric flavodoxin WrbA